MKPKLVSQLKLLPTIALPKTTVLIINSAESVGKYPGSKSVVLYTIFRL